MQRMEFIMNEKIRKDRIAKYLIPKLEDEFFFDEFSDNYLSRSGLKEDRKSVV